LWFYVSFVDLNLVYVGDSGASIFDIDDLISLWTVLYLMRNKYHSSISKHTFDTVIKYMTPYSYVYSAKWVIE
jgi:hypothetical protein